MADKTLADLARRMAEIDIAMLMTHTENGAIAGRPMSNNGDVDYDGDSYYFTWDNARMIEDIENDPNVTLSFQGEKAFAVTVEGKAKLVRDKMEFADHWTPDLDEWFKDGIDTVGVTMIHVRAARVHYWDGEEDGDIHL